MWYLRSHKPGCRDVVSHDGECRPIRFALEGLTGIQGLLLDQSTFEDFKVAWETIVDVYPRVELLPRVSSAWKTKPLERRGCTEWTTPIGTNHQWVTVRKVAETIAQEHDFDIVVYVEAWGA